LRYRNIIIFIAAIIFFTVAIFTLSDDILNPYVSFRDAKANGGDFVQVIGKLDISVPVKRSEEELLFTLMNDANEKMSVAHKGPKPLNFENAEQIVALGRYDAKRGLFFAERLLTKCPSKYKRKI